MATKKYIQIKTVMQQQFNKTDSSIPWYRKGYSC